MVLARVTCRGMAPRHRPTPDTNRLSGSFRITGITERSYRRPWRFRFVTGMLKPTTNPLRDAGWRVNKRKRRSKAGNNWTSTFISHSDKHGRHVYYSKTKKQKQYTYTLCKESEETHADLQPNKAIHTATLIQFYFITHRRLPTSIYTKPIKNFE